MNEFPKINTIWKRDERGRIIEGDYAMPEFAFLADCQWEWTEKVDGTNIRIGWDGAGNVAFGGRTDNAQLHAGLVAALREMFADVSLFEAQFGTNAAVLHGEGYGAGIQKGGGNYSPEKTFVLYDVQVADWWLLRDDVAEVAERFALKIVPIVGVGPLSWAIAQVKAGVKSAWGDFPAEGLVGRPFGTELFARRGDRILAKIKAVDFERLP